MPVPGYRQSSSQLRSPFSSLSGRSNWFYAAALSSVAEVYCALHSSSRVPETEVHKVLRSISGFL